MIKKTAIIALAALVFTGCANNTGTSTPKNPGSSGRIPLSDTVSSDYSLRLTSPQQDQVLKSPFLVGGEANVPGDIVYIRVKNPSGDVVISEQTRVKTTQGAEDQSGPFGILLSFVFRSTNQGTVEVYGIDPATGGEVALESIDVNFDTSSDGSAQTGI